MATKVKHIALPSPIIGTTGNAVSVEVTGTDEGHVNLLGYTSYVSPNEKCMMQQDCNHRGIDVMCNQAFCETSSAFDAYGGSYDVDELLMDGTSSIRDLISGAAFTMTGGVGGAWTEESNFRTLLGASAPVIAGATDNLLSDESASFEGNTIGGYVNPTKCVIAADATQGWHGTHSLKMTCNADGDMYCSVIVTAETANAQFTVSGKFKGVVGKTYRYGLWGDVSGFTWGTSITADGTWQTATATKTFAGDSARRVYLYGPSAVSGNVCNWDAIQLEAGAVATPFCLNSRTACTCKSACPFTAAPLSLIFFVNEPWAGNDGVLHTLYDDGAVAIYKTAANNLTLEVTDAAAAVKTMAGAVTAVNMAANTNHCIVATVNGGTLALKLNNTALTTGGGAGTGIPANFGADSWLGTDDAGANHWNGALIGGGWGRALSTAEQTALSSLAAWSELTTGTVTATKAAVTGARHVITDLLVSSDLAGATAVLKDGSTTKASFVI